MRRTPRPCSGAASRSLLPSLAARTATCSHPTTRRLTHARRKEAQLHTGRREGPGAAGRAQSRLGGRVPLSPRRRQESEGSAWSRRGLWAPSQPFCLSPPLPPGAGGRRGDLRPIRVVCGPLRKGQRRAPLPHSGCRAVGARSLDPPAPGEEWVTPGTWVVLCRPFPSWRTAHPLPSCRQGSSGALGTLPEEGPGAAGTKSRARARPLLLPWGPRTQPAHFCFRAASARLPGPGAGCCLVCPGPRAREGPRVPQPHGGGACWGRARCQEEEGCAGGLGEARVEVGRRKERPLELPGQGPAVRGAERGAHLRTARGEVDVGAGIMNRSGQRAEQQVQAVREALARNALAPCPGAGQELGQGTGHAGGLGSAAPTPALA